MRRDSAAPHRVVGLLVGEVVTFDLAIPDQVFGRTAGYTWTVCGPRRGWLPTETGLAVRVDHGLGTLDDADTIVVPGIGGRAWPVPPRVLTRLRAAHARGTRVVSVCTGAFVLAAAGLLDGRRATTHWRYADLLARSFPAVEVDPAVLYVDHGDVATSAGLAAGIDLCLHLVSGDLGADRAAATARTMVVPPHRRGGQAQFVEAMRATSPDVGLANVLAVMAARCAEPLPLSELARLASMSPRTFTRRFRQSTGTTVGQWLQNQRIALAQRLLEGGDQSIESVAAQAGFGSAVSLRQHFAAGVGIAPSAYRRQFRRAG